MDKITKEAAECLISGRLQRMRLAEQPVNQSYGGDYEDADGD